LRLFRCADAGYIRPSTFLGVGGWKVFRDDIWGKLRFVFPADHENFKRLGAYDFPQKDLTSRARNLVMKVVTTVPVSRRGYLKNLTRHIVTPFQKVVDSAGPAPSRHRNTEAGPAGTADRRPAQAA